MEAGLGDQARRGDQEARAEAGLLLQRLPCPGYLFFCSEFKIEGGSWVPCLPLGEWKVGWMWQFRRRTLQNG